MKTAISGSGNGQSVSGQEGKSLTASWEMRQGLQRIAHSPDQQSGRGLAVKSLAEGDAPRIVRADK